MIFHNLHVINHDLYLNKHNFINYLYFTRCTICQSPHWISHPIRITELLGHGRETKKHGKLPNIVYLLLVIVIQHVSYFLWKLISLFLFDILIPYFLVHYSTIYSDMIRVFVINIMIPGPPYMSFVLYLEGDKVSHVKSSLTLVTSLNSFFSAFVLFRVFFLVTS